MDISAIKTLATEIAKSQAFTYAGNFGRGEFTFQIKVDRDGDCLTFSAPTNARISEKRAQEELRKFWSVLGPQLEPHKETVRITKVRGYSVWRAGFWNMGRHSTTAFVRGVRVLAAETAA